MVNISHINLCRCRAPKMVLFVESSHLPDPRVIYTRTIWRHRLTRYQKKPLKLGTGILKTALFDGPPDTARVKTHLYCIYNSLH
ncbi:hypothetical protein GDO81_020552 [Engystomops pustulosus]|uniref:Uncharacterized protein n=1 Tax=Engystomops pustulosus TaxID=76066 RepID=A0AAV6ZE55_ENGPU|nr:hypothetical protein GDO81_020552 [Engystomops pustulosus]